MVQDRTYGWLAKFGGRKICSKWQTKKFYLKTWFPFVHPVNEDRVQWKRPSLVFSVITLQWFLEHGIYPNHGLGLSHSELKKQYALQEARRHWRCCELSSCKSLSLASSLEVWTGLILWQRMQSDCTLSPPLMTKDTCSRDWHSSCVASDLEILTERRM